MEYFWSRPNGFPRPTISDPIAPHFCPRAQGAGSRRYTGTVRTVKVNKRSKIDQKWFGKCSGECSGTNKCSNKCKNKCSAERFFVCIGAFVGPRACPRAFPRPFLVHFLSIFFIVTVLTVPVYRRDLNARGRDTPVSLKASGAPTSTGVCEINAHRNPMNS
jgi:hypothetical protein